MQENTKQIIYIDYPSPIGFKEVINFFIGLILLGPTKFIPSITTTTKHRDFNKESVSWLGVAWQDESSPDITYIFKHVWESKRKK